MQGWARLSALGALVVVLLSFASLANCIPLSSNSSKIFENDEIDIFVHVVAHSHQDPGWLRSIEEYYDWEVNYILSGVVEQLEENPERRFIEVEMGFFRLWWGEQTDDVKERTRQLVKERRLRFVLGGESMPDEADSTYEAVANNLYSGHAFIEREFGPDAVPEVSWHIDPFGHSSSMAALYGSKSMFSAMVINRIDYRSKQLFKKTKSLDFVWRASPGVEVLTHILDEHYCTPDGFDWEHGVSQELPQGDGPAPVVTRPEQAKVDVRPQIDEIAFNFVNMSRTRASYHRTKHLLVPFGCDFNFQNARMKYQNMDRLIHYINAHQATYRVNVQYSTLDDYFDAIRPAISSLPYLDEAVDFFPYADGPVAWIPQQMREGNQEYWTGFYTSRPHEKGIGRLAEAALRRTEGLVSLAVLTQSMGNASLQTELDRIDFMYQESGVFQHHDAVTGTERAHVRDDYTMRLTGAMTSATDLANDLLPHILGANGEQVTQASTTNGEDDEYFAVVNSVAWERTEVVSIGVPDCHVEVVSLENDAITQQIVPTWAGGEPIDGGNRNVSHPFTLSFIAQLPPAGVRSYRLVKKTSTDKCTAENNVRNGEVVALLNGVKAWVNGSDVVVAQPDGAEFRLRAVAYTSSSNSTQPSGAYIFRPTSTDADVYCDDELRVTSVNGPVKSELRISCGAYESTNTSLYASSPTPTLLLSVFTLIDAPVLYIAHSIGVIPTGEEVSLRYLTPLSSGDRFYSDTNCLRVMTRQRVNGRPGDALDGTVVSANMYPVGAVLMIKDNDGKNNNNDANNNNNEQADAVFDVMDRPPTPVRLASNSSLAAAVLVGRPVAGTSMRSGELELLVHRRLRLDDYRGVREPLNDDDIANGIHALAYGSEEFVNDLHRLGNVFLRHPLHIHRLASSPSVTQTSALVKPLPPNVHLQTFQILPSASTETIRAFVRLHHLYMEGEHSQQSAPVAVDLETLFVHGTVVHGAEVALDGAQRSERKLTSLTVELNPLDIRSFFLTISPK